MAVGRRWRRARLLPVLYDVAVEHERLARLGGRLLWGADVRAMYAGPEESGAYDDVPPDGTVLDVPCGGGVAFRGVPRGAVAAGLRYVAADLSPVMLRRARAEADRRGVAVAPARVDVTRLPFPDGTFDLCLTYNGLHCLPDQAAALAEMSRVLRPGGRLRGSAVVAGAGARQDAFIALIQRRGEFGEVTGADGLRDRLAAAGLADPRLRLSGAFASFTAAKPGGPPAASGRDARL